MRLGDRYSRFLAWALAVPAGALLAAAGASKLVSVNAGSTVIHRLGLPEWTGRFSGLVMPGIEIGLGVAILLGWTSKVLHIAIGTFFVLTTAFLAVVWFRLGSGEECGCFGGVLKSWSAGGVDVAILRNITVGGLYCAGVWALRQGAVSRLEVSIDFADKETGGIACERGI